MSKRTPGPWSSEYAIAQVGHKKGHWEIVGGNGGAWVVADLVDEEADAHLIAAAPDLYEVLEQIANNESSAPDILAQAALAKARGEV